MEATRARTRIEIRCRPPFRDRVDEAAELANEEPAKFVREAIALHVERITGNQVCRGCWEFFERDEETGKFIPHRHNRRTYEGVEENVSQPE